MVVYMKKLMNLGCKSPTLAMRLCVAFFSSGAAQPLLYNPLRLRFNFFFVFFLGKTFFTRLQLLLWVKLSTATAPNAIFGQF